MESICILDPYLELSRFQGSRFERGKDLMIAELERIKKNCILKSQPSATVQDSDYVQQPESSVTPSDQDWEKDFPEWDLDNNEK